MNGFLNKIKEGAKNGIIFNNPLFVQILGTCPALATSTSVMNGIGMGLSVTAVLVFSNLLISLLRKFIPAQIRIASYVVIISSFVTALEMLLKAYIPVLDKSLGLFIPLIVVNCVILARAEAFASKNGPIDAMLDGLFMGLGYAVALISMGTIREVLGVGTFLGFRVTPEFFSPAMMFILPPGAFITLGFTIALFKLIAQRMTKTNKEGEK